MYQIDVPSAAQVLPAPTAQGAPGYFTDGDLVGGIEPTIVPAHFLNALMLEVLSVLAAAGITPDKAQYGQLASAIKAIVQAPAGSYAIDTGSANAYAAVYAPAVAARVDGLTLAFRATTSNTGAATFAPNGLGAKPVLGGAHAVLQGGEIVAGGLVVVIWSALHDAWVLLGCTGGAQQVGLATNSKHAVQRSQLGAAGFLGIGHGLEDDGAGAIRLKLLDDSLRRTAAGVRASQPVGYFAGARAVVSTDNMANLVSTGAGNLALVKATTLWNGFAFSVDAQVGDVTVTPVSTDKVDNRAAGIAYLVPEGTSATFICDGAGNWAVMGQTAIPGSSPAPEYVAVSRSIPAGQFNVDTSTGPVSLTLPATPSTGTAVRLVDPFFTWAQNNAVLTPSGTDTIDGAAGPFPLDVAGADVLFIFKNGNWSIEQ
jgi:hypothetical protein